MPATPTDIAGLGELALLDRLIALEGDRVAVLLAEAAGLLAASLDAPPASWVRIRLAGHEAVSPGFRPSQWFAGTTIRPLAMPAGRIEFGRHAPPPDPGRPFSSADRHRFEIAARVLAAVIDRHVAQAALAESRMRFQTLVEGALTGISIVQDDQVVYQNTEMARLLGPLPRSSKLADFANIHPEDIARVEAFNRGRQTGDAASRDIQFRFYLPGGQTDDAALKWVHCRTSTIRFRGRDAMLVNIMDITETKEMEHLLRMQDKMTSLGRVAAGIAHEIRNPLSGINIYLNTLDKLHQQGDADPKITKILRQLRSASGKIESVIRRVMDFSKPHTPRLVGADVNTPVREAVQLSQVTLRKAGIRLEMALAPALPACRIDPQLIEEVVLNLITNAAEALRSSKSEKTIRLTSSATAEGVQICVADTGPGIPAAQRQTVFDPFFTTKDGSTGIGLSLSQRIVSDHGGTLRVEAEHDTANAGARFVIALPAAAGEGNR